ncbi:methionyl-tRNA formyltransferase [Niallia circulans]|jgi:methionyl-tRNA formyltransferase|uniref:Methionyl-tRNA formyltransferase n=1 Tax=Niallia circulans TaxID=1397 RepID=A0A0J1IQJ9_NIACI|nr:methionyl-tRNA formyltransferase [Niallia circulans]KLV28251.1 methionyl-tRNA formyltransferase [Niallia circulans]MCM2979737.1 methionyl-tRNA formyltransferase [Niallia circulans]MDR4315649.1 methionyl-tRNA formyltransferase [Niallia circulans]MED3837105.1 methionyl-tRNA formyltransferase [Niallia circulans]MED4244175.1 methionyl-tRNA formyltransferase [Niallia circulans]
MTKVVFMGTPDFSVPVLQRLLEEKYEVIAVVTQPDRPVGRKKVLTPPPVKVEALKHDIPVYQPEKIRQSDELKAIISLNPDIIVTAAFGQILPKELLDAPKFGCVNVHASLLPELRGGAPIHYSILQGKEKTGITIMYMAEKLDAGDIISVAEVEIEEEDTVGTLHDKLSRVGSDLLAETLPKLLAGEITPIPQKDEEATFAPNLKRADELIDWSVSGEEIYNKIRGLNPWPVAFTLYQGKVMKVWAGKKVAKKRDASPGTIVDITDHGPIVATGNDTYIQLTEVQPAGKKKMDISQFLRGAGSKMQVNEILGVTNEEN